MGKEKWPFLCWWWRDVSWCTDWGAKNPKLRKCHSSENQHRSTPKRVELTFRKRSYAFRCALCVLVNYEWMRYIRIVTVTCVRTHNTPVYFAAFILYPKFNILFQNFIIIPKSRRLRSDEHSRSTDELLLFVIYFIIYFYFLRMC